MRKVKLIALITTLATFFLRADCQVNYGISRPPLKQNPFIELPIGAIEPQGWLREMLLHQKDGATGNLDKLYPLVMNERNGWLGGDGDQWERGPYWMDGLVPLAYILKDQKLINKTKPWIEWTLNSQQPDGYFGPSKDYTPQPGLQRDNSHDWWPKIVMLKVLKQYYEATGDRRVIAFMTRYFAYQLKQLPSQPLDHWTFWAKYRGPDNLLIVYWLYNITGDKFLLDLGDLIHLQTFDYTNAFLNTPLLSETGSIHGVNLAQGMKGPVIYYQRHPDQKYIDATEKGYRDLKKYNGMPYGLFGGDEALHGNNPTQGSELCTAVEMMFTLENTMVITGATSYADQLEKIAFNALPSQIAENFIDRQYFQQANQVKATRHLRNFDFDHEGTDICYGPMTGYSCCTSNMHQGWPKFTQNLWFATPDSGVAAILYSPSKARVLVGGGTEVSFTEQTNYPFEETVRFTLATGKEVRSVHFPFYLRVPDWCKAAAVRVNGENFNLQVKDNIVAIHREWKSGDVVELTLPMHIIKNNWYENAISVERGPLVYALQIGEKVQKVTDVKDSLKYGNYYYEITPATPWNYGLVKLPDDNIEAKISVIKKTPALNNPWSYKNPPVILQARAKRIPSWSMYNDMAGPVPYSVGYGLETGKEEKIILVPYGCTRLRISEFPVVEAN